MGSGSSGWFGYAIAGVRQLGSAHIKATGAGDLDHACQRAREVVARARGVEVIGAGGATEVVGGRRLAVAGRAVTAVVFVLDPFSVLGDVGVEPFDQDMATGGD